MPKSHESALAEVMTKLADINAHYFRNISADLPAMVVIAPRDKPATNDDFLKIVPVDAIAFPEIRAAIKHALLTVTCMEGHLLEVHRDDPQPEGDPADHPDARRCMVYLAQGCDGTRACGVQYILTPEHGKPSLAPLKLINGQSVALVGNDIADLTRPGCSSLYSRSNQRRDLH